MVTILILPFSEAFFRLASLNATIPGTLTTDAFPFLEPILVLS